MGPEHLTSSISVEAEAIRLNGLGTYLKQKQRCIGRKETKHDIYLLNFLLRFGLKSFENNLKDV